MSIVFGQSWQESCWYDDCTVKEIAKSNNELAKKIEIEWAKYLTKQLADTLKPLEEPDESHEEEAELCR
jgi:hypothetical protein